MQPIDHAVLGQTVVERHLEFVISIIPSREYLNGAQRKHRGDNKIGDQIRREDHAQRPQAPPGTQALFSRQTFQLFALKLAGRASLGAASCAAVAPADRTAIVPTTVLASDNSAVFVRRMAPAWALTKTCHFATHL